MNFFVHFNVHIHSEPLQRKHVISMLRICGMWYSRACYNLRRYTCRQLKFSSVYLRHYVNWLVWLYWWLQLNGLSIPMTYRYELHFTPIPDKNITLLHNRFRQLEILRDKNSWIWSCITNWQLNLSRDATEENVNTITKPTNRGILTLSSIYVQKIFSDMHGR